jgi:type IV secretion system protein VirD4
MAASIGTRRTDTVAKVAVSGILGMLGALYLAGYVFLWTIGGKPYAATPVTVARYAYYYGNERAVRKRLLLSGGVGVVLMGGAFALAFWPRSRSIHGDARFATRAEIRRAGLFAHEGILLGRLGNRYLVLAGQQGALIAAPPRSGKGVGVVMPNLLNFPGSVVCVDIKRENWTLTAGYRAASGQKVFLLDFFSEAGRTARWNPLDYVVENPLLIINGLQRIGDTLWPEVPGTDPFWSAAAQTMFLGLALYVFETPGLPRTIGEILRQGMVTGEEGFGAHWRRVIDERWESDQPLSDNCVRALSDLVDLAGTTASGIRKTFTSRLDLWLNPILDAATSCSDFDLRALRKEPISIYVGVNPNDVGRLRRVLNLFFEQAIGEQTRELPEHNPALRLQLLMVLDEFTALGRLPIISSSLGYLPGYNVRTMIVVQAFSQLREIYGVHGALTILKALGVRIVFAPKEQEDAEAISAELGMTTVKTRSHSRSAWGSGKGPSTNESERARPLMLPQEVKEMGEDTEIVFYENLRPVRAKKIRYFEDPLLKSRILPPPEVPMILDPSRPPPKRLLPPEPESDGRIVERIPARPKPRPGPIRPRQKPRPGSLAGRSPPTDPAVIDSAVSAYLAKLVENDSSPGGNPPSS